MGNHYQEKFIIPFEMADVNGRLKLPQFLNKILDVSGSHSANLGRSDVYVLENYQLVWIVTDYEFLIGRLPHFGETVTIFTEAVSYNKLICYRIFKVFDEKGDLLMTVNSYFALMSLESRKLVTVPDDLLAPYESEKVKKIVRGIKYGDLSDPQQVNYHVRYFDIDMNGHVNNSKYLDWMYDVMGYDFLKNHQPAHIHLKYSREVSPGGDILSQYQVDGLTSHHQIYSEGQINAQAIIEWRQMIYKGYLIDLDGTIYRGTERIPAGERFIQRLQDKGIPYLLVTNNTMRTPEMIQEMLAQNFHVQTPLDTIYTATLATVDYMNDMNRGKTAFVIGEIGLKSAIEAAGYEEDKENPAYVVVGLDRDLTYEDLVIATLAIQKGALFIGTNPDLNIPTERGLLPGAGSVQAFLEASTRVKPIIIGKPAAFIVNKALDRLGVARSEAIMVGDNYQTDIMAGIKNDVATLLVTTGFTKPEEVPHLPTQPDHVLNSLDEWSFDGD